MSKTPYVMAVAWRQFCAIVAEFAGKLPDREPPDLPWLAVYVLPYTLTLPPETGDDARRPRALPRLGADRERVVRPRLHRL
jgi:hypothetical protein